VAKNPISAILLQISLIPIISSHIRQRSSEKDLHTVQSQSSQQRSNKLAWKDGLGENANAAVSL
jgi:hypothetical protein